MALHYACSSSQQGKNKGKAVNEKGSEQWTGNIILTQKKEIQAFTNDLPKDLGGGGCLTF